MIKVRNSFIAFVIILLLSVIDVHALEVNTSATGSMKITYSYGEKLLEKANVQIYKVGTIDKYNHYTYLDSFKELGDINKLSSSDIKKEALKIEEIIVKNKIQPLKQDFSNKNGEVSFNDLGVGLYFIRADELRSDTMKYTVSPSLVPLPLLDEINNKFLYQVIVNMKAEASEVQPEKPVKPTDPSKPSGGNTDKNPIKSPQTYDTLREILIIFVISIVGILGIIGYKYYEKKRGEK